MTQKLKWPISSLVSIIRSALVAAGVLAIPNLPFASEAQAQGWFSYEFDYVEQDEARSLIRSEYSAEFEIALQEHPDTDVRIGIGVLRTISGKGELPLGLIIARFDHPFFCREQACRVVMLIESSQRWNEVFDGFSDEKRIVRTDTGSALDDDSFNWCVPAFGGAQLLSWNGYEFRVRWDSDGSSCWTVE